MSMVNSNPRRCNWLLHAREKSHTSVSNLSVSFQLAADAGNAVAMTDDEKKRLADILEDLEELNEIPTENNDEHGENGKLTIKPGMKSNN